MLKPDFEPGFKTKLHHKDMRIAIKYLTAFENLSGLGMGQGELPSYCPWSNCLMYN